VSFLKAKHRLACPLLSVLSRTVQVGHCIVWCSVLVCYSKCCPTLCHLLAKSKYKICNRIDSCHSVKQVKRWKHESSVRAY